MRRLNPKAVHYKLNLTPAELVVLKGIFLGNLPLVLTPTYHHAKTTLVYKVNYLVRIST